MDIITRASLEAWTDSIEEMLEKKHDELMDLEYVDEDCSLYREDEVWDIFRSCEELLMHCVNMMRKVIQEDMAKCDKYNKKPQLTDLEIQYAQRDDELMKEIADEGSKM